MPARSGWFFRLTVAVLFVVIFLVAIGLGWAKPGLFFYVATSAVGLLVWLDYEYNKRRPSAPDDVGDALPTTAPHFREGGGPAG